METPIQEMDKNSSVCVSVCVCCYVTHKWESDDRSLKAPSGISDMSLPWRDLSERGRENEGDEKEEGAQKYRKGV